MQRTLRLTTGQALVRFLAAQYTERDGDRRRLIAGVFGILGHGNTAGIGQGLADVGHGVMPFYQGKNEQAMVHAAIGYAKENYLQSTLAVTTSIGPGAANLVTGAGSASINRVPVLLLPGDVFARRQQGPVLQQIENPLGYDVTTNDALRPVSRYFDRITRPEQLIESLPRAVAALTAPGDAGAVTLSLCQDVQGEAFDWPVALFEQRVHHSYRRVPADEAIAAAAAAIASSERPLIISGGGVRYSRAEAELATLANESGVPVAETYAGRGGGRDCRIRTGGLGIIGSGPATTAAADTDLVIAIGTRLTDTVTGSHTAFAHPDVKFIALNVSQIDLVKNFALPVDGDARVSLTKLKAELDRLGWRGQQDWLRRCQQTTTQWQAALAAELAKTPEPMRGYEVIDELAQFTIAEDVVVVASSTAIGYAHANGCGEAVLDLEYGYSCMGYEIPAALGHVLSRNRGDCYTVLGDGTYLMGYPGEFVTAIQEGKRFTAIVLVNNGWQCINRFEQGSIGRTFGTQFKMRGRDGEYSGAEVPIDYAANAAAYGCVVFDVHSRDELRHALKETRAGDRPILIAAHVVDDEVDIPGGTWWDFGSAEVDADGHPRKLHESHVEAARAQRWYV